MRISFTNQRIIMVPRREKKVMIPMRDWMALHPYDKYDEIDLEYLNVAKVIANKVARSEVGESMKHGFIKSVAVLSTAYLEDVVSGLGIWAAFRSLHKKKYGRLLPFFEVDKENYSEDKINKVDLQVLLWMGIMEEDGTFDDAILNPEDERVCVLTDLIYSVLEEVGEGVSKNSRAYQFYRTESFYRDFDLFKALYQVFIQTTYLFFGKADLYADFAQIICKESNPSDNKIEQIIHHMAKGVISFRFPIGPFSEYAKVYLAEMISDMPLLRKRVEELDYRPTNYYKYCGKLTGSHILKSLEGEDSFAVSKSLFSMISPEFTNGILCTDLVFFNNRWYSNSFMCEMEEDAADNVMSKIKQKSAESKEKIQLQEQFLKANNNSPIAFVKDRVALDVLLEKAFGKKHDIEIDENIESDVEIVVFVGAENTIVVAPDLAVYIKHPDNPYYSKEDAEDSGIGVVFNYDDCDDELCHYLVQNKLLPDVMFDTTGDSERAKTLVQQNMDFIACFSRGDGYYTATYKSANS